MSRRRAGVLATFAVAVALSSLGAAGASADTQRLATTVADPATPVTVTHTDPSTFAWQPFVGKKFKPGSGSRLTVAPSVTVAQTTNLRYQTVQVSWQHFTPSVDSTGATRTLLQQELFDGTVFYDVGIFECRGADPVAGLPADPTTSMQTLADRCYTSSETSASFGTHGLGNAASAVTRPDGTGSATFTVETGLENDLLSCSPTQQCSLVVVPAWGGQGTACTDHRADTNGMPTTAADDAIIPSACDFRDRFVVPLSFAPTPTSCGTNDAFSGEGAYTLQQAVSRWQPSFCSTAAASRGPVTFAYNSGVTESQARMGFLSPPGAFAQSVDTAFTNRPATAGFGAPRPFDYAPVANSGVVVAFVADDPSTGAQLSSLRLDARLVAKLVTQSYAEGFSTGPCVAGTPTSAQTGCGDFDNVAGNYPGHRTPCAATSAQSFSCDPNTSGNPNSIVQDPEFKSLNPSLYDSAGLPTHVALSNSLGLSPLLLAGGDSDAFYELTSWIESDPDAHAFLGGVRDQWGMHVNAAYQDVDWPATQPDLLDSGWNPPPVPTGATASCVPVPLFVKPQCFAPGYGTMQTSLNPVNGLTSVVQSALIARPSSTDLGNPKETAVPTNGCTPTDTVGAVQCQLLRAAPQARGQRFILAIMDSGDAANFGIPTATLLNPAGSFVDANAAGLAHGLAAATVNPDGTTTSPDFVSMTGDGQAYPLPVTDYAMVPTCGLGATAAAGVASFLQHAVAPTAQTAGLLNGQLAGGYLPLTKTQTGQTQKAIVAVGTQKPCPVAATPAPPQPPASPAPAAAPAAPPAPPASPSAAPAPAPVPTVAANTTMSTAYGVKAPSGLGDVLVISLLSGIGLAALLLGGPGLWWVSGTASGAAFWARVRRATGL